MITNESLNQGFAWRTGHVELYTVNGFTFSEFDHDEGWSIDLKVLLDEPVALAKETVRAIQIPFSVLGKEGIFICGDQNSPDTEAFKKIAIPPGDYSLVFEQGWKYNPQPILYDNVTNEALPQILYTLWGRLWFNHAENVEPKILFHDLRDTELNPSYPLHMDGVPM